MSTYELEVWANSQAVKRLREIAVGMPYLSEAKKAEIVTWLLRYNPDAIKRAKEEA